MDTGVFPAPTHLAAWAGLILGSFETDGKNKRAPTLKGNIYLKTMLVECAGAAVRAKGTFYIAKFNQLRHHALDYRKALVAALFEQRNRAHTIRNLTRRADSLLVRRVSLSSPSSLFPSFWFCSLTRGARFRERPGTGMCLPQAWAWSFPEFREGPTKKATASGGPECCIFWRRRSESNR